MESVRGDRFVGLLSVDGLLVNLSAELADLTRSVAAETFFSHRDSPVPATAPRWDVP